MSEVMIQAEQQGSASTQAGQVTVLSITSTVPNSGTSEVPFILANGYNVGIRNVTGTAKLSPATPNPSITVGAVTFPQGNTLPSNANVLGYVSVETSNTAPEDYSIDIDIEFEFDTPPKVSGQTVMQINS